MSDVAQLHWLPGHRIGELVRNGGLTAREVTEAFLRRAEVVEPCIHSFITVAAEFARSRSATVDALAPDGRDGAFLGVPFSAKDNICTSGVRTTMASKLFETYLPPADASVIARLADAGGVLLGKANLPEFSMWARSGNLLTEECRNPWDVRRTSGGSSGGSGAAVAAGLVPISIGTDDGGSIRLPAALNGVFGLFPSPCRVPMDGVVIGGAVSAAGPLTRDVKDAALFLEAMNPGEDFTSRLDSGVAGLRMAWTADVEGIAHNDARVVACAREAAFALGQAGALVEEPGLVFVDSMGAAPQSPFLDLPTYGGLRPFDLPETRRIIARPGWEKQLAPNARPGGVSGEQAVPSSDEADRRRRRVVEQIRDAHERWDVLLTPTIDQVAPMVPDDWSYPYAPREAGPGEAIRQYVKYTMRVNLAGGCAASVPCGFVDGMPVALQVIGRRGEEMTVLRVARALERIMPWADKRPNLPATE
jgi:Asp-tRNA(Asn)/Glu-tRNA(Gln) amidotransferase A subunit family amidase